MKILFPAQFPRGGQRLTAREDDELLGRSGHREVAVDCSFDTLAWRPYRTWAAVHLRALREQRTGEISGR